MKPFFLGLLLFFSNTTFANDIAPKSENKIGSNVVIKLSDEISCRAQMYWVDKFKLKTAELNDVSKGIVTALIEQNGYQLKVLLIKGFTPGYMLQIHLKKILMDGSTFTVGTGIDEVSRKTLLELSEKNSDSYPLVTNTSSLETLNDTKESSIDFINKDIVPGVGVQCDLSYQKVTK